MFYSGYERLADVLLQNGANISAEDSFKNTPLHLAAKNGKRYFRIKVQHLTDCSFFTNLFISYEYDLGHENLVKLLLRKGANINSEDGGMNTALHVAVKKGKLGKINLHFNSLSKFAFIEIFHISIQIYTFCIQAMKM